MNDPNDLSLRLDDSTRERISKLAEQRKTVNSKQTKAERKSTIIASTGKYTEGWNDEDVMMSPRRPSDSTPKPLRKKKSKIIKKDDEMSMSAHSGAANRELEDNDEEEKKSSKTDRDVRRSPNEGKLGKMLGNAKPIKKRGAKTVASMPVGNAADSPTRKMSSERREKPKSAMKTRTMSPGPMKRRTASPGPMSKRSASPGPMKERSKSSTTMGTSRNTMPSSPRKRPSMQSRSKSTSNTYQEEQNQPENDHHSTLEKLLGTGDSSSPKRRPSGASVSSAPAMARKASRRPRASSRGPLSNRRSRSIDLVEPLVQEKAIDSPQHRRAKSVDDVDVEISDEELKDDTDGPPSPKNFSRRLSKRLNSIRKLAGFGGGGEKTSNDRTETQKSDPEHAPRRTARAPARSAGNPKRSSSAGPLTNRPALRRDKDDRRAALSKSRQNNGAPPKSRDGDDDDEEDTPPVPPQRAQSMMLHREATRRGKSNSLMDLINYSEEEIHSTSYFASNHVLVNRERMKRGLRPLTRNIAMDELARENAKRMAESGGVTPIPATYVGNVLKGESIRAIHRAIMQNKDGRERANILNPYFQDFGVGTSKSEDGMLFICQLFSERLELTVTDTTK